MTKAEKRKAKKAEQQKLSTIEEEKKEEEPMIEEVTDEQADQIQSEQKQKKDDENEQIDSSSKTEDKEDKPMHTEEEAMDGLKALTEQVDLMKIDEGDREVKEENIGTRRLLSGFKQLNAKIYLLSGDLDSIFEKQKYAGLFDIGVLSTHSCNYVGKEGNGINKIFKKGAMVHIETVDQLCICKDEQKKAYRAKVEEKCTAAGWKQASETPYTHHMLYHVDSQ